jgi:hypothetical protein
LSVVLQRVALLVLHVLQIQAVSVLGESVSVCWSPSLGPNGIRDGPWRAGGVQIAVHGVTRGWEKRVFLTVPTPLLLSCSESHLHPLHYP